MCQKLCVIGSTDSLQFLPVFVIARFHPVERFPQGRVRHVLVVHLFHLEAVGQIFELDVSVFLDRQFGVGNGFVQVSSEVLQNLEINVVVTCR